MKTTKDLERLIEAHRANQPSLEAIQALFKGDNEELRAKHERAFKRAKKNWKEQLDRLLNLKVYVSSVDPIAIIKTRDRLKDSVAVINERWRVQKEELVSLGKYELAIKNAKKAHDKMYGTKLLERQLAEMEFICE